MIKCFIDDTNTAIQVSGSTVDIAANIVELINKIYSEMKKTDADNADGFKHLITESTEVMFMNKDELRNAATKKAKEAVQDILKNMPEGMRKELAEMLSDEETKE